MYRVVASEDLAPNVHLLKVEAPTVARKIQPGQFVIVMVDEKGERIPLTISDWDESEGIITIVFLEVGMTTYKLAQLKPGAHIFSLVGPLGLPTRIEKFGTVICAGGCYGIGAILPVVRALKKVGNEVISIIEARSKFLLFWEEPLRQASDKLIVTTGDGSYGRKGWVNDVIKGMLEQGQRIERVFARGCPFMMMLCSEATRLYGVNTIVSLNSIMVDGTGMCGCCRVSVGGETKFACVDGPDFEGHKVDWDLLMKRQRAYLEEEKKSLELWETDALRNQSE